MDTLTYSHGLNYCSVGRVEGSHSLHGGEFMREARLVLI